MTQHEHRCRIIPFPAARRTGRIKRVAEILSEQRGRGAETYWQRVAADMRRAMERAGVEPDIIERELLDFEKAVAGELVRGGAA